MIEHTPPEVSRDCGPRCISILLGFLLLGAMSSWGELCTGPAGIPVPWHGWNRRCTGDHHITKDAGTNGSGYIPHCPLHHHLF